MSAARARAILDNSGSIARLRALGSSFWRCSSTRMAMRVSSATIWVLGSGRRGPAGGGVAQPASASMARRRRAGRLVSGGQYLEQPRRAHAAADAHGDHAILGAAPPPLQQDMAGQA